MKTTLAAFFLLVIGCGSPPSLLPDGGRPRQVCTSDKPSMTVRVIDAAGAAVEGALVTARNAGLNREIKATTGSNGATTGIGEDIGQGTVTVQASANGRSTEVRMVTWVCGECHCNPEPDFVVLTLN